MASNIRDYKLFGFQNGVSTCIVEIDCDTVSDLPEPQNNWLMGSIAHVISTGDFYELNSSGAWVNQTGEDTDTSSVSNLLSLKNPVSLEKTVFEPADETQEEGIFDAALS